MSDQSADVSLVLEEFLPYQLSITSNALSDLIAGEYKSRFGLKIVEWRLMAVLGGLSSATQRELVAATLMDKVTVNRGTKTLVDRGLLTRLPNAADGRSHHLALSDTGRDLYRQIVPATKAIEAKVMESFSGEELNMLSTLLKRIKMAVDTV